MKRIGLTREHARRALPLLVAVAALTMTACDTEVTSSFSGPQWPGGVGERTLHITGSLTSNPGSCLEATVLFDGVELSEAQTVCPDSNGCSTLELAAVTSSGSGHHTISFQVLSQTQTEVEYTAQGEVLVTRDGLTFDGVRMGLGPRFATLRSGESVSFDVYFQDWD